MIQNVRDLALTKGRRRQKMTEYNAKVSLNEYAITYKTQNKEFFQEVQKLIRSQIDKDSKQKIQELEELDKRPGRKMKNFLK